MKEYSKQENSKGNILPGDTEEFLEDKNDDILENISLKKPDGPFQQFTKDQADKFKKEGKAILLRDIAKNSSGTWAKMDE
jgi:hypothetical protein